MDRIKLIKFVTLTVLISNCFTSNTMTSEKKNIAEVDKQLRHALETGDYKEAKKAIENGANLDMEYDWGGTPLVKASYLDPKFTKLLLDSKVKAFVNQKTKDGSTALHSAASSDNVDNIKLLISAGADVNIQNNEGYTPLLYYFSNVHCRFKLDVIKLFLDHGADLTLKSKFNRAPIDYIAISADEYRPFDADVLKLFQEYQEKRRKKVQEEVNEHLAPPGLADIVGEYVVGPKEQQLR